MTDIDTKRCPACGQGNACGEAGSTDSRCWCFEQVVDPTAIDALPPSLRGKACLCQACASRPNTPRQH